MRRLALVLLLACSKSQPTAQSVDADAPVPKVAIATAAPVDAAPSPTKHATAFAHFVKGQLFECVDMTLTVVASVDAGADPFAKASKKMKDAKRIDQSCAEAFGDRQVLATCTISDADGGNSASVTASFYNFEDVGLSDSQMSDCFDSKGKWKAISRDSPEWRKAKLEHSRKGLQKSLDKLNDLQPPPSDEP